MMFSQQMNPVARMAVAIALVAVLSSCGDGSDKVSSAANPSMVASSPVASASATTPASPVLGSKSPAADASKVPTLKGKATVVLTVKGKPITIEVNGTDAPITAGNFVDLVQRGFYNGTVFHRVIPGFVAQGGDPYSKLPNPPGPVGTGGFVDPATGKPRDIPLEIWPEGANVPIYGKTLKSAGIAQPPKLKHERGVIAMARSPEPDSASSQFYIALDTAGTASLDGDYAVFGKVTDGLPVVDAIRQGDTLDSAKVTQGLDNLTP